MILRFLSVTSRTILGMLLTGVAGWIDAMAFLHVGAYSSFMSGNSTRFSLMIEQGSWLAAAGFGGLIAAFVLGAAGGTVVAGITGRARTPLVLVLDAAVIALVWASTGGAFGIAGAVALALAMGFQNALLTQVGPVRLGKTYVTGVLATVGQRLGERLLGKGSGSALVAETLPWIALVLGAVAGGWADATYGGQALLGPVVVLLALAALSLLPILWPRAFSRAPEGRWPARDDHVAQP